jgi:hypothetical protein
MLVARLLYECWDGIIREQLKSVFSGLVFIAHLLLMVLTVRSGTTRKKPWRIRSAYPSRWLTLSAVVLNMQFIGILGALDYDSEVHLDRCTNHVMNQVVRKYWKPPVQPPDRQPTSWASTVNK